jgi:hypothetical protein
LGTCLGRAGMGAWLWGRAWGADIGSDDNGNDRERLFRVVRQWMEAKEERRN